MQAEADSISALKDSVKDVGVRATDYLTAIQVSHTLRALAFACLPHVTVAFST
jgi:hypothetical protein